MKQLFFAAVRHRSVAVEQSTSAVPNSWPASRLTDTARPPNKLMFASFVRRSMIMTRINITVAILPLALAGCADKLLSNDRIRDSTALALNVPATSIVISDRRYDGVE